MDIEGHTGADGRAYVLDTARVFPPEAPNNSIVAVQVPIDVHLGLQRMLSVYAVSLCVLSVAT